MKQQREAKQSSASNVVLLVLFLHKSPMLCYDMIFITVYNNVIRSDTTLHG